ncbi:MAG TPA: hypothetical protein VF395_22385 [Polyangiaceae bacterium]
MLPQPKRALSALAVLLVATTEASIAGAQPAPSGAHPRLWLDAGTLSGLKAQASVAKSPIARGAARCSSARTSPGEYATGGWQGFEFVTTLSGCLISWEATGNADDLATAIKYWNVLLDDYETVGDGNGGDSVVTHDTGYAMRTFAPYSAIAYDWLHDAPGVTETLRAHARSRFDAWTTYYGTEGYLRHMVGANYEAGYVFAATLMAIAEGAEAGATGDGLWATVRDTLWGQDMATGLATGGVLDGGDWPEGWQYGPLSVLEHALAGRAMQDNGAPIAGIGAWADSLVLRFAHGLGPATKKTFAAGDNESTTTNLEPMNGALLAAIAGPAGPEPRAWARQLNTDLGLSNETPLFDALAAARVGESKPPPANSPTSYLARGAGNWYVRGDWSKSATWAAFQCSRRLVDDHEHNDAGNWVLTRGADDVVVDPSPYGSLSSLTGNAPAVDSAVLPSGYSPSQAGWGKTTRLVWAKQATSGVGMARCDYADQFRREDVPSDVAHAIRDFVVVPSGSTSSVVLIDRVVTGDAARSLHFRVRTPAALGLSGDTATGTVGGSSVGIRRVWSTSGTPSVRDMPLTPECSSDNRGTCDMSRLPAGREYRLDVTGPSAGAIHVIDAQATGGDRASSVLLSGSGYRGVLLDRGGKRIAVVANDGPDAAPGSSLAYRVPAGGEATHVVVDAPTDDNGRSDVTSAHDGSDCAVTVAPHTGSTAGFDGHGLILHVTADCAVTEDGAVLPADPTTMAGAPSSGAGGSGSGAGTGGTPGLGAASSPGAMGAMGGAGTAGSQGAPQPLVGTVSCSIRRFAKRRSTPGSSWLAVLGLGALLHRRQRRRR